MPVKKNIKNLVWCERLCRNALEIMCQLTTICNDYALNVCFCRPFLRLFFEGKNFSHEQSTGISSRKSQKPPERFAPLSHWENQYSISFHSEWDMILVTVFLSILNQMEIHLVQNRKENCPHDHTPVNVKGIGSIVVSVQNLIMSSSGADKKRGLGGP